MNFLCGVGSSQYSYRHAHIYGIDLASPSELVAHDRNPDIIAKHIGADKVIFQDLEDLQKACAEALPEKDLREGRKFEVGVFNGEYVTPVQPGYFEHYEQVRRKGRQLKTQEGARDAAASGSAIKQETEAATNGVHINGLDHIIRGPETSNSIHASVGHHSHERNSGNQRRDSIDDTNLPRDRMDISLHNFGDYAG